MIPFPVILIIVGAIIAILTMMFANESEEAFVGFIVTVVLISVGLAFLGFAL